MKLREAKELKSKSAEELKELEKIVSSELLQVRLKHGVGQLEQTTSIRELRRDIARVKTRALELSRKK
jgi:large subunit ribosomal protein L29